MNGNLQRATSDFWKVAKDDTLPPLLHELGVIRQSSLRQYVMEFTPQDAKRILEHIHPSQRKLSEVHMRKLLRAMQAGEWHEPPFTFDSIAFDAQGRLCNGLHRLTALARYDKPLKFVVLIGVQPPNGMPLPEGDAGSKRREYFVAGKSGPDWSVISFLTGLALGTHAPGRADIVQFFTLFVDALKAMPNLTRRPQPAPVRAAFVFQWAATNDVIYRQELSQQWEAYSRLDVERMWSGMGNLYRVVQIAQGQSQRVEQFAKTIYAIDHPTAERIHTPVDACIKRVKTWVAEQQQERTV